MNKYRVSMHGGREYVVDAPSKEAAWRYAQRQAKREGVKREHRQVRDVIEVVKIRAKEDQAEQIKTVKVRVKEAR